MRTTKINSFNMAQRLIRNAKASNLLSSTVFVKIHNKLHVVRFPVSLKKTQRKETYYYG